MQQIDGEREKIMADAQSDTIDLAFAIAEKVLGQKIISDKNTFFKIYEKAVKDIKAQKWVKLSVSKHEVEFATQHSDYLLSVVEGAERIEIEVLEDAPAGTCIVETSEKIVDASIKTQIGLLRDAVFTA